jgi:hypothetical protein
MTHAYERIRNGIVRVMYSIAGVAILGMIIQRTLQRPLRPQDSVYHRTLRF